MEHTNEMNMAESGLLPFDPIVLLQDVLKRWLVIVLAALAVGFGAYIYTDMTYEPVYQTNTTFVVTARGSANTVYSNLSSTSSLANVFTDLLNSSILHKTILEQMGAESFDGTITTQVIPQTNLITMTVTAPDPRTAFQFAQLIIENHESLTYKVVDDIALEVLQSPVVPAGPRNYANSRKNMEDAMVISAIAACAALLALSFFRDAVRSGKEARNKLDSDFLGEVPHEKKYKTLISQFLRRKSSILITSPVTSFPYVEAIRKLRRRVEQHMDGGKVLMVTSLLENEGKSTVAVNLALSLAQKHRRVLLIDCDLRKPAVHNVLENKKFPHGLRDVLQEKARLSEALIRYKKTNLYLLLEKKGDTKSGDMIASESMEGLLNWAREEFDFIVLDLPPVSGVSDAEGMADLADASVLVVRQNVANASAINRAIAALESGKAKHLGCVLNNVYTTRLFSGRGYGYGNYNKYNHYGHYGR